MMNPLSQSALVQNAYSSTILQLMNVLFLVAFAASCILVDYYLHIHVNLCACADA